MGMILMMIMQAPYLSTKQEFPSMTTPMGSHQTMTMVPSTSITSPTTSSTPTLLATTMIILHMTPTVARLTMIHIRACIASTVARMVEQDMEMFTLMEPMILIMATKASAITPTMTTMTMTKSLISAMLKPMDPT